MEDLKKNRDNIDVVIYHYPCNDGLAAFFVAVEYAKRQQRTVVGIPKTHDGKMIEDHLYVGKNVLMVDIVTPDYLIIAERAASLTILDHHKTEREKCANYLYAYFDESLSGVGLAWRFFNDDEPMPALLQYIQERDLFAFSSEYSRNVSSGLMANMSVTCSGPHEIEQKMAVLSFLINTNDLSRMEAIGMYVADAQKNVLNDAASKAIRYKLHLPNGNTVHAVVHQCVDPALISNLGAHLIKNVSDIDCVVLWRYNHQAELYWYSLRSDEDHGDASAVAALFPGGGGHRNACGFTHALHPAALFSYEQLRLDAKKPKLNE